MFDSGVQGQQNLCLQVIRIGLRAIRAKGLNVWLGLRVEGFRPVKTSAMYPDNALWRLITVDLT